MPLVVVPRGTLKMRAPLPPKANWPSSVTVLALATVVTTLFTPEAPRLRFPRRVSAPAVPFSWRIVALLSGLCRVRTAPVGALIVPPL